MFSIYGEISKTIDKKSVEKYGIDPIILMENAAIASCNLIIFKYNVEKILIVSSTGNNGGDGFALARHLINKNYLVTVVILGDVKKFSFETRKNFEILKSLSAKIVFNPDSKKFKNIIRESDLLVDAIFGTGFKGIFDDFYRKYIKLLNNSAKKIFSLDVPSGLNSNTGETDPDTIRADTTITFGLIKTGLLWKDSKKFTGDLYVADISLPYKTVFDFDYQIIIEKDLVKTLVKTLKIKREDYFHKRERGNLVIIGGNNGMEGSTQIAALGALKTGVGIVYIHQLGNPKIKFLKEPVYFENVEKACSKSDNIIIGCGFGNDEQSKKTFIEIMGKLKDKNILIDADGLNIISKLNQNMKKKFLKDSIVTPHPEEFFRLTGKRFTNIKEKISFAKEFSLTYSNITVLKSPPTIVTNGQTTFILPNSNLKLATAGSGDLLSGIIGAYISFGYDKLSSAILGVFTHFYASEKTDVKNPLITQIAENIGKVQDEISI